MEHIEALESRRLLASGDLDPTFGAGGRIRQDLGSLHFVAAAAELSDGKILIAGGTSEVLLADQEQYMLRRYNADGSPDTSFGQGGEVLGNFFPVVGADDENHDPRNDDDSKITDIFVQPDGKIVAKGKGMANAVHDVVARFNADGSLDSTFAGDGVFDNPPSTDAQRWTVQPDGKVLLAAGASIVRIDADGTLDTGFGSQGTAVVAFPFINLINVESDGKILLGGGDADGLSLTRLNANGSLDTTFGTGGVIEGPALPHRGVIQEMIVLPGGKILAAGTADDAGRHGYAIARFNPDATLDTTYGDNNDGDTFIPYGPNAILKQLALEDNGNAVLLGYNPGYQITRVSPNGIFDEAFGRVTTSQSNGGGIFPVNGFTQANGNFLVVGLNSSQVAPSDFRSFVVMDRLKSNDSSPASPISFNAGVVSLQGTSGDDVIQLFVDGGAAVSATLNGFGRSFIESDVDRVDVTAGAGDDFINAKSLATPTHISGGPGSDKIAGGFGRDTIEGNGGRDFLDGNEAADVISGGAGNDQIRGQASSDHLYGRAGNDYIEGNGGNDVLDGGTGVDVLHGTGGNDLLVSADDNNAIDSVFGDDGQDRGHGDTGDLLDSIETLV